MGSTPTPPQDSPGEAAQAGQAAQSEGRLLGYRAIKFRTGEVDPPAFLYVSQDDFLAVSFQSSQSLYPFFVSAQLLLPDGRLQVMQFQVNINAAQVYATNAYQYFGLAEGFLLSVTVYGLGPTFTTGQTFVQVFITKGQTPSATVVELLISGYLSTHKQLTWPGGRQLDPWEGPGALKAQLTASFPAGTDISYAQSPYTKWLIRSFYAQLTTSAAVASRQVGLFIRANATQIAWADYVEATQAASTTGLYAWGLKSGWNQTAFVQNHLTRSLPELPFVSSGVANVLTFTTNLQAGDQWTNVYMSYEEWLI